jgi:hypothetical protein
LFIKDVDLIDGMLLIVGIQKQIVGKAGKNRKINNNENIPRNQRFQFFRGTQLTNQRE